MKIWQNNYFITSLKDLWLACNKADNDNEDRKTQIFFLSYILNPEDSE